MISNGQNDKSVWVASTQFTGGRDAEYYVEIIRNEKQIKRIEAEIRELEKRPEPIMQHTTPIEYRFKTEFIPNFGVGECPW